MSLGKLEGKENVANNALVPNISAKPCTTQQLAAQQQPLPSAKS